ncbi:MAG: hypothetical protein V2I33_18270 [Kangiellaceae bacterium]|jgi:hypothetical protein|nr:hypothetical protein [Kangiellaceae bacterium]
MNDNKEFHHKGALYKIGRFGLIYRWSDANTDWVVSTLKYGDLNHEERERLGRRPEVQACRRGGSPDMVSMCGSQIHYTGPML